MELAIQPAAEISGKRRFRSAEERRSIVEETLVEGVSVAVVARRHGVNANQVFQWRKLYQSGLLEPASQRRQNNTARLLAVTVVEDEKPQEEQNTCVAAQPSGAIHIEFPGRVLVRVEGSADAALVHAVLESLRG